MARQLELDVWGDLACFTRPESKVERLTYPVPTPSGMRGILSAIYSKPKEFYWQIDRIQVFSPISYISFKRNEVKRLCGEEPFLAEDTRTQRQTVALRDVRYRVSVTLCKRASYPGSEEQLVEQARRRIETGKCFFQPSLGLREFPAYFAPISGDGGPIPLDLDLGYMLYDVFDLNRFEVTKKANPSISFFHARLEQGVLEIPPFDSPQVLKPEGTPC